MKTAHELRQVSDNANSAYSLDYIEEFIEERALSGSYNVRVDSRRMTKDLQTHLENGGYLVMKNSSGTTTISWEHS